MGVTMGPTGEVNGHESVPNAGSATLRSGAESRSSSQSKTSLTFISSPATVEFIVHYLFVRRGAPIAG